MSKRLLQSTVVLLAIAASGCADYPGARPGLAGKTAATDLAGQPLSLSSLPQVGLTGVVLAPAHVVAAGGGNVVAAGGGNVIAAGGGNVVAAGGGNFTGGRRVLALAEQVAVAGAEVYLADLSGARLPDFAPAFTDAAGRFTLRGAPAESAYMVVARFRAPDGADVTLTRLGHASRNSRDQVLSVATTLVSAAFVQRGAPASRFDPDAFDAAVTAVAERLSEATLPDLTRPADVAAKAAAIAEETPAVRRAIDEPASPDAAPAAEPLVDQATHAAPAASGGHKGKSSGKADRPAGAQPPSAATPEAPGGEPAPDDTAPAADGPPPAEPPAAAQPQPGPAEQKEPKAPKPKSGKGANKEGKGADKHDKGSDKEKPGHQGKGKGGKPA